MSPCQKAWNSQILNGDKVAIKYKSRPSPFHFSKCLQHWGAGAPTHAVSLLPFIIFATNEAARQGTGQLSHRLQNRTSLVPGQGCCCGDFSGALSGGGGSRVHAPRLGDRLGDKLGDMAASIKLAPLRFLKDALPRHPPPLPQQLRPCQRPPFPRALRGWEESEGVPGGAGVSAVLTCCWL